MLIRVDEYTYLDRRTGQMSYKCCGCDKMIRFDEFNANKGYCDDCREGRDRRRGDER